MLIFMLVGNKYLCTLFQNLEKNFAMAPQECWFYWDNFSEILRGNQKILWHNKLLTRPKIQ
jgi:hypothetical protein